MVPAMHLMPSRQDSPKLSRVPYCDRQRARRPADAVDGQGLTQGYWEPGEEAELRVLQELDRPGERFRQDLRETETLIDAEVGRSREAEEDSVPFQVEGTCFVILTRVTIAHVDGKPFDGPVIKPDPHRVNEEILHPAY